MVAHELGRGSQKAKGGFPKAPATSKSGVANEAASLLRGGSGRTLGEAPVSRGCILVIDNDPQIRRMMRTTLVAQGFEVGDARNGEDGLEGLRSERYDLVLLDINMPGMSGIDVCREIRRSCDIGIIMLSVRTGERDKTEAFDAGA